jgi:chemotaxis response regulator CheB
VKLESDPRSAELLASIFRSIHSIKGGCGFLGFTKLQALAHAGESLLSKLRDGILVLTPQISSALLTCGDGTRQMLAAIAATEQDGEESYTELIATLKRLQEAPSLPAPAPAITLPASPFKATTSLRPIQRRIDIVAIGTSTGGPNALGEVIPALLEDLAVPVVVVQHMPALFTRMLAKHLDARAKVAVQEGSAGIKLQPGEAWIAPGDYHMTVVRDKDGVQLAVNQDPPEHSCRPAVDVLFRSVARTYGPHALAVVMTGMGSDGAIGARAIRQAGGEILIQDQASSVVWGMPGAVAAAGLADQILPLSAIAQEIARRVASRRVLAARVPSPRP